MIDHFDLNGDESQAQDPDHSDQDSQYPLTPGFYGYTPTSFTHYCTVRAAYNNLPHFEEFSVSF
jgi:hypothetical protein